MNPQYRGESDYPIEITSLPGGTIDIDEFENAAEDDFQARNDTVRDVMFLDEHDDRAWKAAMIADRLDLEPMP